jgi:hypothetical protein
MKARAVPTGTTHASAAADEIAPRAFVEPNRSAW